MFKLVYSDDYFLPIGAHVFPAEKYRLIQQRLLAEGIANPADFVKPEPASDDDVRLAHTSEYVKKLRTGSLTAHRRNATGTAILTRTRAGILAGSRWLNIGRPSRIGR